VAALIANRLPLERHEAVARAIRTRSLQVPAITARSLSSLERALADGRLVVASDGDEIVAWFLSEPSGPGVHELGFLYVEPQRRSEAILPAMLDLALTLDDTAVAVTFRADFAAWLIGSRGFRRATLGEVARMSRGRFLWHRLAPRRLWIALRRSEATRRVAHVVACLFGLLVYFTFPLPVVVGIALLFAAAMLLSRWRHVLTSIHSTRRRSLGEVYLPLGIAIPALLGGGHDGLFVTSVLVLGLADVAAGVTGDLLRSPRKTWWGTLAFAVVAAIVVLACGWGPVVAAIVGVLVSLVERVSSRGTDNLSIPFATSVLLLVLGPISA
jgi:phytol kinase